MALNLRDLARMCEFNFELASLGTVRCLCLNANHISQVNKEPGSSGDQSLDVVRWLFGEMARRPIDVSSDDADTPEAPKLTAEELSLVTDAELEAFADKLIQMNRYLLKTHKSSDIERSVDESACDFLVRAFRHHAAEQKAQWERMTEPMSKSLFASATVEAMQRNLGLSNQFQDTIDKYARGYSGVERMLAEEKDKWEEMAKLASQSFPASAAMEAMQRNHGALDQLRDAVGKHAFDLPNMSSKFAEPSFDVPNFRVPEIHIPKNPIHDTNAMLEGVVRQIEELRPVAAQAAQIIRSMNDTALRMQTDYIENSQKTEHQTQITIQQTKVAVKIAAVSLIVSAFGLVISAFFSYQSYVDAKKSNVSSDAQIKAFQSEIRDLVAAQREERAAIVKTIVDARRVPAAVVKK